MATFKAQYLAEEQLNEIVEKAYSEGTSVIEVRSAHQGYNMDHQVEITFRDDSAYLRFKKWFNQKFARR